MKKIGLVLILLVIVLYFNRAYAHIYSMIKGGHLPYPTVPSTDLIGEKNLSKQIIYVALGDSLTAGAGADRHSESFPYLMAQKMALDNSAQVKLINLGIPGARANEVLHNQIPQVLALKPDIITLLIGVNDLHNFTRLNNFESDLTQIFDVLKQSGAAVNIITIPYLGSNKLLWPPYPLYFKWQTLRYNQALAIAIENYNFNIIDLNTLSLTNLTKAADFYCRDQFHPSALGYSAWANYIYARLNYRRG